MTHSKRPMETPLPAVAVRPPSGARHVHGCLPWIEDPQRVAPKDARALSKLFFEQLQFLEEGSPEYQYTRNTLIEMNGTLVRVVANRFRGAGDADLDDIVQVGTIGLIKAISRFDLSREVEFTSFAIPCILGEIKRYFRDNAWAVHVPRRLQELRVNLAEARKQLATALARQPTVKELAAHLELSEEEIIDGLVAANGYTSGSLDDTTDSTDTGHVSDRSRSYEDTSDGCDPALDLVEDFQSLAPLPTELEPRERSIVQLRAGMLTDQ